MDFDLSDEQRLLKVSVDRLILDQYQFQQRKNYMAEPPGFSAAMWTRSAESWRVAKVPKAVPACTPRFQRSGG